MKWMHLDEFIGERVLEQVHLKQENIPLIEGHTQKFAEAEQWIEDTVYGHFEALGARHFRQVEYALKIGAAARKIADGTFYELGAGVSVVGAGFDLLGGSGIVALELVEAVASYAAALHENIDTNIEYRIGNAYDLIKECTLKDNDVLACTGFPCKDSVKEGLQQGKWRNVIIEFGNQGPAEMPERKRNAEEFFGNKLGHYDATLLYNDTLPWNILAVGTLK